MLENVQNGESLSHNKTEIAETTKLKKSQGCLTKLFAASVFLYLPQFTRRISTMF